MPVNDITPTEYSAWLARGDETVLLDVREDWEYQRVHIKKSVHIPMNQIPERIDEIDPAVTTVVMCHSGDRSLMIANYLQQNGHRKVLNLRGGIDAWAVEVDPALTRY